jgi:hypothetical protein
MSVALPLDQMSMPEKLEAMESLWADLSRNPAELRSPDWHRGVLAERKRLADEGKLRFVDWDEALSQLRKEVRGHSAP